MDVAGTTAVVMGAGKGIGAAVVHELARRGASAVMVCDLDRGAAERVAASVRELGVDSDFLGVDVTSGEQVDAAFDRILERFGRPDVVCSNVGVGTGQGLFADPEVWTATWETNVLGHILVARRALPLMIRNRTGHFMITASAAGLLGLAADAPYSVTKYAAVGLAEWLAVAYGGRGVDVSVLCPLGVRTDLLTPAVEAGHPVALEIASLAPLIEPEEVARVAVDAIGDGRFLVLPHPEVADLVRRKAAAPDQWVAERRPARRTGAASGAR